MIKQNGRLTINARLAAELTSEMCQPLTAASNYIATARLLLGSMGEQPTEAVECLEKAGKQILRAGVILRKIDDQLAGRVSQDSAPS
jgi:phosphoglycerate-specific signal transduction histidine kinase